MSKRNRFVALERTVGNIPIFPFISSELTLGQENFQKENSCNVLVKQNNSGLTFIYTYSNKIDGYEIHEISTKVIISTSKFIN